MNMGETRVGKRVRGKKSHEMREGEYMLDADASSEYRSPGSLWLYPPGARHYMRVSSTVHSVAVHPDGTITVSPSILYHPWPDGTHGWHGFLQRGVWSRV